MKWLVWQQFMCVCVGQQNDWLCNPLASAWTSFGICHILYRVRRGITATCWHLLMANREQIDIVINHYLSYCWHYLIQFNSIRWDSISLLESMYVFVILNIEFLFWFIVYHKPMSKTKLLIWWSCWVLKNINIWKWDFLSSIAECDAKWKNIIWNLITKESIIW